MAAMVTVIRGLAECEWSAGGHARMTLERILAGLLIERVHETVQRAVMPHPRRGAPVERFR